ncbi:MAG: tRNA pseudouridine(55) synthase TruB [Deltaproteobacteria bacterium]|nr:tRNA pseudouridine(55) synthase TruB [Deltaproteobacteria bacterium]
MRSLDGILLVDKPAGETSFQTIKRVRRAIKIQKVGHAGTLDPFATGLLIIMLGQATKLSPYLMAGVKHYQGIIHLGVETETMDPEGRVTRIKDVPPFGLKAIQEVVQGFIGEIEQTPPSYSALKHKGKRAYALARQGIKVDLPKRVVRILAIEICSVDLPEIVLKVRCSGGTYIRRLAADIGGKLGTGAHLKALRRLSSGPFNVENALESTKDSMDEACIMEHMIPLADSLPDMPAIQLDHLTARRILNGYKPDENDLFSGSIVPDDYHGPIKLLDGSILIAVMEVKRIVGGNQGWIKKMRIFH